MPSLPYFLLTLLDTLVGHLILTAYLVAVTDERDIWRRLKKLPSLLPSPLFAALLAFGLRAVLPFTPYFIASIFILVMCTLWVMRTWRLNFWCAFSTTCMAAILQVATSALTQILFLMLPAGAGGDAGAMASALIFSIAASALLRRFRFGVWFRMLLEDQSKLHRTAVLVFALVESMEAFFFLQSGIQERFLAAYYILVLVLVLLIVALIVHMAHRFDDSRALRLQRDIIAQQQLYEQNLEDIRREVRSFRHDYKNLLAGLSQ